MERNSTTLSMKDHQRNTAMRNNVSNNNNTKDHSRNHHHHHVYNNNISQRYHDDEDYMINGFSWPPRSYTCSFCKREFRSAQALGGHMNVHRKDRARLRQSPPRLSDHGRYCTSTTGTSFLNLNLNNSNPNPKFSLTSPPLSSPYSAYSCPNNEKKKWAPWTGHHVEDGGTDQLDHRQHLTINGSDFAKSMKSKQSVCGVGDDHDLGFSGKNIMYDYKSFKKADQAPTNVRLDLEIGLVGADSKMGRDLDLELRLGYSTY